MAVASPPRSPERVFEDLLRSDALNHDPWSRPNLQSFRPRQLKLAKAIAEHLKGPRRSILDIGHQNGFFLRYCHDLGLGFERFIGVDFFAIEPERSFLTGMDGVEIIAENFNRDHFLEAVPDESVDCVVSTEVFEHLYHHPTGYLNEAWRVLRPGGVLVFSTPNPCTLANAIRLIRGLPFSWGGVAFADTPKIAPGNEPVAVWDVHFREYVASELLEIVRRLPDVEILDQGFLATETDSRAGAFKRVAKGLQWGLGLGRSRLLSSTQYLVLRKRE